MGRPRKVVDGGEGEDTTDFAAEKEAKLEALLAIPADKRTDEDEEAIHNLQAA